MTKTVKRHGISVGIERSEETFYMSFKGIGKLTHDDYAVMTPMIDSALKSVSDPTIRALFDMTELDGWEPRAAWDDFRLGLRHGSEFTRVAIVGNKRWQELSARVGNWILSGDVRYFEAIDAAVAWLREKD
jgi:hypothetical protein